MAAAARLVSTTLARSSSSSLAAAAAASASAARRPDLLASSPRGFSSMADSIQRSGSGDITRVLFCGPYWPASTNFTKEYLQSYPFIQAMKNRRLDSDIIAKASQMKIIMQYGVGLEGVDVNAATEHKIKVARIPGSTTGNAVSCAEMAIYLTLGVLRKQKVMDTAVKRKDLGIPVGDTIFGKSVLILGFGAIGVEIAKRLRPFGVKILATKRNWSSDTLPCDIDELVDKKGGPEDMYEFAGEADIVGIVDHKFLSAMKKGSYLVNIARGRLLDYDAVFNHLKSGHLGGLGIDVAWTEPYDPEDPILKFSNVIITPHIAGVTEYSYRTMAKVVGDVALKLHSGEPITEVEFVN
uniref:D-isomer specific 2-hydroxyacid dehydrogenase NAD-binding domain-containing protein n=1 Tax=Oryza meridionalis TaxID=40149 RepID=A0A0E0E9Y6_9ORYZ